MAYLPGLYPVESPKEQQKLDRSLRSLAFTVFVAVFTPDMVKPYHGDLLCDASGSVIGVMISEDAAQPMRGGTQFAKSGLIYLNSLAPGWFVRPNGAPLGVSAVQHAQAILARR